MWPNPQFSANLVTFTEEIFNRFPTNLLSAFILQNISGRLLLNKPDFTAQKMKFSIKDSLVNETKSAGNCEFGLICQRNP